MACFHWHKCYDCGREHIPDDFFMVHDSVWKEFGIDAVVNMDGYYRPLSYRAEPLFPSNDSPAIRIRRGLLCLTCLGKRMGRPVNIADLKPDVFCNQKFFSLWSGHVQANNHLPG